MESPRSFGDSRINLGSDYTPDEVEFIKAMELYMKDNKRRFPTFTEVLAVAYSLGYRKTEPPESPPIYYEGRRLTKEDRERRKGNG